MTNRHALTAALLSLALAACGQSLEKPSKGNDGGPVDGRVATDVPVAVPTDAPVARDAGSDGACVSAGSVTFRLQASAADGGRFYARSLADPGDGIWWYSVAKADGTPLQIFLEQANSCNDCREAIVPIGYGCSPLPDGGVTGGWDGIAVTGFGTCLDSSEPGQGALSISCDETTCMPPGRYIVTMCVGCADARLRPADGGSSPCVSVPFDYPTSTEVVGTIE